MALPVVAQKLKRNRNSWNHVSGAEYHQIRVEQQQYYASLIYDHDHAALVLNLLATRYKHAIQSLTPYVAPVMNPLKTVANVKAQVYSKPPIRRGSDPAIRTLLASSNSRINRKLDHACKILNSSGNVLIWPTVGSAPDSAIALDLQIFQPHEVNLVANYRSHTYDIAAICDQYIYCYWFDGDSHKLGVYDLSDGNREVSLHSAIGRPVWCSIVQTKFGKPRCNGPVNDLIAGTLSINQMEAFAERVTYLKSFKQPVRDTEERVKADNFIAGPDNIWPEGVTLVDLVDHNDIFESMIEKKYLQLCNQHGVSSALAKGEYKDMATWESISEELLFHFGQQVENWQYIEQQIWESVLAIEDLNLPQDGRVTVRFTPPFKSARDPMQEHELHRTRVKDGYESTVDRVMDENPHLVEREEAKAFWLEQLDEFAEEVKIKRELNIPGYGESPQENGAAGAAARFGEIGRNGPSVSAPDEVRMMKEKEA